MASNEFEDAPFGVFKMGYSWITWLSTIGLVFLTVWTLWIMFQNTPAGTRRSQEMAEISATIPAIPRPEDPNACGPPRPTSSDVIICTACHVIPGISGGGAVGPDLTNIRTVALERIEAPDYAGSASNVDEYLRESIYEPSAYVVPGDTHGLPGASVMQPRGGMPESAATDATLEKIIAWLQFDPETECPDAEEVALR